MFSLLIPVFNFDVRPFVRELNEQALETGLPFEILCLDDRSEEEYKTINREIGELPNVIFEEAQKKEDRAGARNQLFKMASYEWLIFLDCDGKCPDLHYLKRYLSVMESHEKVFYGGRLYNPTPPLEKELYFHWFVGSNREVAAVEKREKAPYLSFMTNNFMVHREVYSSILMDATLKGYGHEDTLFAQQLKKHGILIKHIPNPIYHIGIEPVDVFLEKSRQGVRNLAQLYLEEKLGSNVKLIRAYRKLKSAGVASLFSRLILGNESAFLSNFRSRRPNLKKFDMWKLALFVHEVSKYPLIRS